MSYEDKVEFIKALRHRKYVERPATAARVKKKKATTVRKKKSKLETLLKSMSPEQIELLKQQLTKGK